MPLISVNIKDSGGLANHSNNVTKNVARAYKDRNFSDLSFICRSGGIVQCHQSMLESLSPRLREMFQAHNCCTCSGSSCGRREPIQIHLPDVDRDTLRSLLDIVYTGRCQLASSALCDQVMETMTMLDLKLPGDFRQERMDRGQQPVSELVSVMDTPSSSATSSSVKTGAKRKRSDGSSPAVKATKQSRLDISPETLMIDMAKRFMPLSENKSLHCNVPGCGVIIQHSEMTNHFKKHFKDYENKPVLGDFSLTVNSSSPQKSVIKCFTCAKEFKYRKALDSHLKSANCKLAPSVAGSEKKSRSILGTPSKKGTPTKVTTPASKGQGALSPGQHKCSKCDREFKLAAHLAVHAKSNLCGNTSVAGEDKYACSKCNRTFGTPGPFANHIRVCGDGEKMPREREKWKCPVCGKLPTNGKNEILKHIAHKHIQDKLVELFPDGKCDECNVEFSSRTLLFRHIASKHDSVIWNLVKDVPPGAKRDVSSDIQCHLCQEKFMTRRSLKFHVVTQHCKEKLAVNNPDLKCSICKQKFNSKAKLGRHYVLYHESHLKETYEEYASIQKPKCLSMEKIWKCPICDGQIKGHRFTLKYHILSGHFKEKMLRTYPNNHCSQCETNFDNESCLLRHLAKKHEKIVVYLLGKEGLALPAKEDSTPVASEPKVLKAEEVKDKSSFKCPKCEEKFGTRREMKNHVGIEHYYEKLIAAYSGRDCTICDQKTPGQRHLIMHICNKHERILEYLLGKENLSLSSAATDLVKRLDNGEIGSPKKPANDAKEDVEEKAVVDEFVDLGSKCLLCDREDLTPGYGTTSALRHYLTKHFRDKLERDSSSCKEHQCFECGFQPDESKKPMLTWQAHVVKNHPHVIRGYLKEENLLPESLPSFSEGENGYRVKKVRVDIKQSDEAYEKAKQLNNDEEEEGSSDSETEPQLPLEQLLKCFLCKQDFNSLGQRSLLSHFSTDHYRLELEHNFVTRPGSTWSHDRRCQDCLVTINSKEEYLQHLGVVHRKVEQFLPQKYRLPPDPEPVIEEKKPRGSEFLCPIDGCGSEKETKKSFLIHLLMIHFNKEMEAEYKDQFKAMNPKKCPECKMALLDNYLGFIKHLAVDHEFVMKYVKKEEKVEEEPRQEPTIQAEASCATPKKSETNHQQVVASPIVTSNMDLRAILDSDSDSD